ncbi:hypothetical protein CEV08_02680 [Bartonella tribocorum]|uniref:Uncharacterized protein n=2 Tax=Bartonella tribocorum TaxID=85701 RepID=A0A2M6UX45_9HYPH|nr:hypothetical protein [Bartonella tribocorum]PIT70717.1 hypothetical protein CEV08_02680 [Bartonella tribocorum]
MGIFSDRVPFILFMFLIFGVSIFAFRNGVVSKFFANYTSSSHPQQVNVTDELLLERWIVAFPDFFVRFSAHLSKMNPKQQELFIEKVRRDAVAFAIQNGQSREQALKFGETVVMALLKARSRPSIADTYF